jgi:hypothetical protein
MQLQRYLIESLKKDKHRGTKKKKKSWLGGWRCTRRGYEISLQVVVSHHMVAGT